MIECCCTILCGVLREETHLGVQMFFQLPIRCELLWLGCMHAIQSQDIRSSQTNECTPDNVLIFRGEDTTGFRHAVGKSGISLRVPMPADEPTEGTWISGQQIDPVASLDDFGKPSYHSLQPVTWSLCLQRCLNSHSCALHEHHRHNLLHS